MTSRRPGTYPFGRPVQPCSPSASSPRCVFVLGAYPSALHVAWTPPAPYRRVQAIAVDNEPLPFWNGSDQEARVETWKKSVGFKPEAQGSISVAGNLNGSSGDWVDKNVLDPLKVARADVWITDSLDTYRCSEGLASRIDDTYNPFATAVGLSQAVLLQHPSESDIIKEASRDHQPRLRQEIETCNPDLIVTLGNAALAVIRELYPQTGGQDVLRLDSSERYGAVVTLQVGQRKVDLLPLAHPAAPKAYQAAHKRWCALKRSSSAV